MTRESGFIGWLRVDDRLIHGQVTVGWYQYLRYREIWVVDDMVRAEPYLGDALRLAAPAGVQVNVMDVDEAAARIKDATSESAPVWRTGGGAVLMLLRDPAGALALVENGVLLDRVNVGNLGARTGSARAIKNVSLTHAHITALDALTAQGVEVFFQLAPEDALVGWLVVRRRLGR